MNLWRKEKRENPPVHRLHPSGERAFCGNFVPKRSTPDRNGATCPRCNGKVYEGGGWRKGTRRNGRRGTAA